MNIDEIKKGLECCSNLSIRYCIDCPYNNDKDWLDCNAEKMHKDALNLINELESENKLLRSVRKNAVKEFVKKLKEKSFYIQTAEDNYHVIELSTIEEEYERL